MSTSSSPPPGTSTPLAELQAELAAALTDADTHANQTVLNVKLVQQARLSGLKRTAAAATAQYGADSPQAKQAQAAVSATTATVARIAIVQQQQATPAPTVSANGWALQGRVYNSSLQPVSGYTVFLVDAKKAYQQAYGFAYTDNTGYFLINYAGTSGLPGAQSPAPPQLNIAVVNTKAEPVYLSTSAFSPAAGSVTYQDIVLAAGDKPLGDPPEAIRKIALPDTAVERK